MTGLWSFNDSTSKRVLDLLETGQITVIKFGVNNRGSNVHYNLTS